MSKNKGGREVRKPKQEKKPKGGVQSSSAVLSPAGDKLKPRQAK